MLRRTDCIYAVTNQAFHLFELFQRVHIHVVEESGNDGFGYKGQLIQDCRKYRSNDKFIYAVIFKIWNDGLIVHPKQIIRINVYLKCNSVICLKQAVNKFDLIDFHGKLLDEQEPCIRRKVIAVKICFQLV